ncbi:MAG TPA: DUF4252 domain-containing protein [Thermoanaerobaculia bacterium]|jgi:hypothetical protein
MRKITLIVFLAALAAPLHAQRLNLDFPALAERASESTDVTLDGPMLRLAAKFLNEHDSDERQARDLIKSLTGIYVHSYEFEREGEYDRSVVEKVRAQLGTNWQPMVTVRSKIKENVDIYVDMRGDNVAGLLIIDAEPRELTLVNLVGNIDLDKLASLQGEFGIPHISKSKEKERERGSHE